MISILEINRVYHGDCLEVMLNFPDNSIDTIITDPPYGLSFMGKKWDYNLPSIEIWQECLRVLKPGGTALIFGGSRTYHRMACNVEDAGFTIKDCIMWVYGSGFPKALDISKSIDKKKGLKREYIGEGKYKNRKPYSGGNSLMISKKDTRQGHPITRAACEESELWNGWKSHALKPSYEPIMIAVKPNEGSYVDNALKWGVSGLNIDGCRISTNEDLKAGGGLISLPGDKRKGKSLGMLSKGAENTYKQSNRGRYPANIIHDGSEEVMELFAKAGKSRSVRVRGNRSGKEVSCLGAYSGQKDIVMGHNDTGTPARFFYCAKASRGERNAGCEALEEKECGRNQSSLDGGKIKTGSGNERGNKKKNNHPTVKPLKLMEYLCNLTRTPEGGIVLDPFAGSGTTGIACVNTGRNYILIEQEEKYVEIAKQRLKLAEYEYGNTLF